MAIADILRYGVEHASPVVTLPQQSVGFVAAGMSSANLRMSFPDEHGLQVAIRWYYHSIVIHQYSIFQREVSVCLSLGLCSYCFERFARTIGLEDFFDQGEVFVPLLIVQG